MMNGIIVQIRHLQNNKICKLYYMIETFLLVIGVSTLLVGITITNIGCSERELYKKKAPSQIQVPPSLSIDDIVFEVQNECAICLDEVNMNDIYILSCNHVYHEQCILKWFETSKKTQCPLCLQ
jgi:hypothetical protein